MEEDVSSKVEVISSVSKKLVVEVAADIVQSRINEVVSEIKRKIVIKGFRKGKAPVGLIKARYKDEIKMEASKKIISDSYTESLSEHSLTPISYPKIENMGELKEGNPFCYEATFDVNPEIDINNYQDLKVEIQKLPSLDKDVEIEMDRMRQQAAVTEEVKEDRAVQEADVVDIDYVGTIDDKPFDGGESKGFELQVRKGVLIKDLENGLLGMKKGESKNIEAVFPKEYQAENLRGQKAVFAVTLNSVKTRIVPELDDNLAQKFGFETLDKMKTSIVDMIKNDREISKNQLIEEKVIKQIADKNKFDLPVSLRDRMIDDMIDRMVGMYSGGRENKEFQRLKEDPKIRENIKPRAELQLKTFYILSNLAKKESIKLEEQDWEDTYKKIAERSNSSVADIKKKYSANSKLKSDMESQIIHDKTLDKILQSYVKVEEVENKTTENKGVIEDTKK